MQITDKAKCLFYNKVEKTDNCWIWKGYKIWTGYGRVTFNNKQYLAHRFAWMIENGEIPEGQHILHKCDNPACVNVKHMELGTHTENMRDASKKGRKKKPYKKVLSKEIADKIRSNTDSTLEVLANIYGVSIGQISNIKNNLSWK